ncbi:alpha/beta-hydrolase [Clavulina sp. PMI_390]|nr:alpha/beta-hydrolase [Clavulina sp. PMI_390]
MVTSRIWQHNTLVLLFLSIASICHAWIVPPEPQLPSHEASRSLPLIKRAVNYISYLSPPPPRGSLLESFVDYSTPFSAQSLISLAQLNITLPDGSGVVGGVADPQHGIEGFLGIPFAQPPTGILRFSKPQAMTADSTRYYDGSTYGVACVQATSDPSTVGEDCLTMNVVRPAGVPSDAKLPVMVWIYGGSLTSGSSSSYNSTLLVLQSMMRGQPIIYASFNYRLGAFGFLSSTELDTAASAGTATLNAGLYDMQLALQWVQNNIEAFGGDPSKVTVFGQSSGAITIGSLLTADGGSAVSNLNLFRAAIMESGAPQGADVAPPSARDDLYSSIANAAGCSSSPALDCLRSVSAQALYDAATTAASQSTAVWAFNRVIDNYFHDRTPSESLSAQRIAFVPLITGNVLDEGTEFVPTNVVDLAGIDAFFTPRVFTENITAFNATLQQALQLYPDDPSQGSPYYPTNTSMGYRFYGGTNQFKRLASIIGDSLFQSGRRQLLKTYTTKNSSFPCYSYLFATNTPGSNPTLGVSHASDLNYVYGFAAAADLTASIASTSLTMMNQWINFAWTLNPNADDLPKWPLYGSNAQMLQINLTSYKIITDNYRQSPMNLLMSSAWTGPQDL